MDASPLITTQYCYGQTIDWWTSYPSSHLLWIVNTINVRPRSVPHLYTQKSFSLCAQWSYDLPISSSEGIGWSLGKMAPFICCYYTKLDLDKNTNTHKNKTVLQQLLPLYFLHFQNWMWLWWGVSYKPTFFNTEH